ncbi:DUF883 family protein [Pseudoduganella aquatica]|uniref:DUF883 family protein n=1 Tax=Pseudoduganella aquatica TaxID=2660641 RepID=A0A7X4HBL1_9BURK|nr:DUF883 family protein [Pseudoduganella aquatica]MYN07265.1 DUF883 family protein [Pseudoduganella aquatica]
MDQTTTPASTLRSDASADRERLLNHLRDAVTDAEQWLSTAVKDAPADVEHAKTAFKETLQTAKTDLLRLEGSMLARGKLAAKATDNYVHEHPWGAVAAGAVVGILAGMLIGATQR